MFRCGDRICGEVVRFSLAGCGGLDGVWVRAGCSSTRVGWVALSRSTLWSGLTRYFSYHGRGFDVVFSLLFGRFQLRLPPGIAICGLCRVIRDAILFLPVEVLTKHY